MCCVIFSSLPLLATHFPAEIHLSIEPFPPKLYAHKLVLLTFFFNQRTRYFLTQLIIMLTDDLLIHVTLYEKMNEAFSSGTRAEISPLTLTMDQMTVLVIVTNSQSIIATWAFSSLISLFQFSDSTNTTLTSVYSFFSRTQAALVKLVSSSSKNK